jgi:hypothetical protein
VFALLMVLRIPALTGGRGKKARPPATRRTAMES